MTAVESAVMTAVESEPQSQLAPKPAKSPSGYGRRRSKAGFFFLLPSLVVLAVVLGYPIVQSVLLSLKSTTTTEGIFGGSWVGVKNYAGLFGDDAFRTGLVNTLYFTVVEVVAVVVIAMLFALLLSHPKIRPGFFTVVLLVPWAITPVASATIWKWIYNANYGILNSLLLQLGVIDKPVVWLGSARLGLNMLLLADIWKSVPFITLLLLAGLRNIPPVLHKAARIDGASRWQAFRMVTLPQLRTTILVCAVLQSIWAMKVFDLVYVLTRGGPADGTITLNYLSYREAFNFGHLGSGAAVANVLFLILLLAAFGYIRVLGREATTGGRA